MNIPNPEKLALRNRAIAPFHVMEILREAKRLELQGKSLIHLSVGEPSTTATTDVITRAQQVLAQGKTQYVPALGIDELREALATFYRHHYQLTIDPDRIIITAGASGALLLASSLLMDQGSEVLLSDPNYPCNRNFIVNADAIPKSIPVDASTRFQLSAALIEQHWSDRTQGVLIPSPSNPTGTSIEREPFINIIETVHKKQGFVIADEIYRGLSYDARFNYSVLSLTEDVLTLNSFSKYFSMTGWRLGWIVAPKYWVKALEKLAQNLFICAPVVSQYAALGCFTEASMACYEQRRLLLQQKRDFCMQRLLECGFSIPVEPDGAFYIYFDCSRFCDDAERFAQELLHETGVVLVPGIDFGSYHCERYLRLSFATDMTALEQAFIRLQSFLAKK